MTTLLCFAIGAFGLTAGAAVDRPALLVAGFWAILLGVGCVFAREPEPVDQIGHQGATRVGFESSPSPRGERFAGVLVGCVLGLTIVVVLASWLLAEPTPPPVTWGSR